MSTPQEANNAIKRTADPRVYAANVRQNVTQQQYTMDAAKFGQCLKPDDLQWDLLDQRVGGMPPCAAASPVGQPSADVRRAAAEAWFPTAPGRPDINPDLDATYEQLAAEPGRKRQRFV
jgi:hypothetical protein